MSLENVMKLTTDQRAALIEKLIDDIVSSARQDSGFAEDFIREVMNDGYSPLSSMDDDALLQWHIDSFEEEFDPEKPDA